MKYSRRRIGKECREGPSDVVRNGYGLCIKIDIDSSSAQRTSSALRRFLFPLDTSAASALNVRSHASLTDIMSEDPLL